MSLFSTKPTTQKDRVVGFVLDNGGALSSALLTINPESLSRSEPSRLAVQQTLATPGAWADNFGPGLQTITLAGHTGWRPKSGGMDWEQAFANLHQVAFAGWHAAREARVKNLQDPDAVKLIFVDELDRITALVAPMAFQLQRNRSRPLLMQYQITLSVLNPDVGGDYAKELRRGTSSTDFLRAMGLDSLADGIDAINEAINTVDGWLTEANAFVTENIVRPVTGFLNVSMALLQRVENTVRTGAGIVDSVGAAARSICQVGANLFRTLGLIVGLPVRVVAQLMGMASVFANAGCLLVNAFGAAFQFPDYSDLYGASNCSSTTGAGALSPLRNTNAWELINAPAPQQVWITSSASESMRVLAANDPVLSPLAPEAAARHAGVIADGFRVTRDAA